jgi:bacillithiol biosynthesis deacetylase BshB1
MNVLAIGAHPDDVDLYAGGLVAGLAARGAHVVLLDLTAGELGTRGTVELRRQEAQEAARVLGVAARECLQLPDGGISATDPAHHRALVEAMRKHRPQLILAPFEIDVHPDHRQAAQLIERASFFSRLPSYPADGKPVRPGAILSYEQKIPFEPHLVVDIGPWREKKRGAVRAFASQFTRAPGDPKQTEISEPVFHEMLEARERERGGRIGVNWGEGYRRNGPHPVHDPIHLLDGEMRS